MFNYLVKIEYDGTNFVGWQSQKNGVSVQEKIEKVLKKIFKSKIKITGAGRTDKGVHASGQYANFIIKNKITDAEQLKTFNVDGYSFNSAMSEGNKWVFCRAES